MKHLTWWVSALLILFFLYCAKDKPLPTGYSDIVGNNEGQIADTVIYKQNGSETYYSRLINTGAGANLLIGNYQNYHSSIYLKFGSLPNRIEAHSAKLYLTKNTADSALTGPSQTFTAEIYHASFAWASDLDPEQYLDQLPFNEAPFQTVTIMPDTSTRIEIELDTTVVSEWSDSTSALPNYGIWIKSSDLKGIDSYYSIENSDLTLTPQLDLIYTFVDSTDKTPDTTTVYATQDAFLTPDTAAVLSSLDPNYFYIGKEFAFRSFLEFDLSNIDSTTYINRALMEIVMNRSNSTPNISNVGDIIIFRKEEESREKGVVNESPSTSSYVATVTDSTVTFDVTRTIQDWISNNYPNYGFLIRSLNEQQTLSRTAFYSSKASSSDLRPKLLLYYTLPVKREF
jgi:hypothetical protein